MVRAFNARAELIRLILPVTALTDIGSTQPFSPNLEYRVPEEVELQTCGVEGR